MTADMRQGLLLLFTLISTSLFAQGTASLAPPFPARGANATLTFDATDGPLEAEGAVVATVGFNGFQNTSDVTLTGTAPNWSGTISVPANTTSIDVVFKNQAATIFDNNGGPGIDWHFVVGETQNLELGAMKVEPSLGGGYLFRLWAPDADSVAVAGDFNGFSVDADLMVVDPASGIWTAHLADASTGDEYKLVLDGSKFRRDPRGRQIRGGFDNSVIVDPSTFTFSEPQPGTSANFRDWVIYEMHIGTLDPASSSAPGRFADLIPERLDYLKDLNINAVHLMPVNEFAGFNSAGYNMADPFAIERDYGTPDEFRAFVDACHERGIAVIVDIVHNHYGPNGLELFDFQDINDSDSQDQPGIYFYDSPPALAESGFGPRPDFSESEIQSFITDSVEMFLNEYNVDGFRWDFTKAIRGTVDGSFNVTGDIPEGITLLQNINSTILGPDSDVISIAEDLAGFGRITDPVTSVSGNPNDGFGFDTQWDVSFHFGVVAQLEQSDPANIDMGQIEGAINGDFRRLHYIESHDEVWELNGKDRVPTRIDLANPESLRSRKMSALGAGLLLTTEGLPMLFQGSELLDIGGPNTDNSWDVDEPIDFSRLSDPNIVGFNNMYRDFIGLRRNLSGTSAGLIGENTTIINNDSVNKVIAYSRSNGGSTPGDTVVVLANFGTTDFLGGYDIGMPAAGTWHELLNTDDTDYGTDFGGAGVGQSFDTAATGLHGFPQRGTIRIAGRSMVILGQADPNKITSSMFRLE